MFVIFHNVLLLETIILSVIIHNVFQGHKNMYLEKGGIISGKKASSFLYNEERVLEKIH